MMLLSKPKDDNDMYGDLASYWYHVDIFFYFVMYSFFFFLVMEMAIDVYV